MLLNALFFVAGVYLLQSQPQLPPLALGWLLVPGAALMCALNRARFLSAVSVVGWKALLFFAGFFWAALLADARLSKALPEALEGVDLQLTGV
ncbi:MAG: DNA internalization-related competence protein ComEC/Rec2, partial [Burkholderiales bacterium]